MIKKKDYYEKYKAKKERARKKADKLWFEKHIRLQCEVCNKKASQVHHFYPKGNFGHLRYDEDNGISICFGCHFAHHHKGDPRIHQGIIKKRGMKWYNRLTKKANNPPKGSYDTLGWREEQIKKLSAK
jgi:5-methylcytosine-specific restriction endonuclease McrA